MSPHSGKQTVFETGSSGWNTGVLVRVQNTGRKMFSRLIDSYSNMYAECDTLTTDALKNWAHFALTNDLAGEVSIKVYKNIC